MSRLILLFTLLCGFGFVAAGCGSQIAQSQDGSKIVQPLPATNPQKQPEIPAEAKNIPLPQGY